MKTFTQQELDLIKQTQKSLRDFNGEYTITLLFNCMEILFIPQRKWLITLPTHDINLNEWGISPKDIRICKADYKDGVNYGTVKDDYSVRNVAKHIHNSVIRYWVAYSPASETERINMMSFWDRKDDRVNFQMGITVENFRTFLLKFSEMILTNQPISKGT